MSSSSELITSIYSLARNTLHNLKRNGIIFTLKYLPYHIKLAILGGKDNFDRQYGTNTSQILSVNELEPVSIKSIINSSAYVPTMQNIFIEIIDSIAISHHEYIFIDLGSGKGRPMLLASNYPFKKIIGVEICKKLNEITKKNFEIYESISNIKINYDLYMMDVIDFTFPDDNLVIYLFNPFGEEVLSNIICKIRESDMFNTKKIIIIYYHPLFHKKILDAKFHLIAKKKYKNFMYGYNIYSNDRALRLHK